jgi:HAD superfamily phosphatase
MRERVGIVSSERARLQEVLARLGANPVASEANFVLAKFQDASAVQERLEALGIAVRAWKDRPELANTLRISCPASPADFDRLTAALETAMRPEALLFDMDGVLADEGPSYREAILQTAESFGVETSRAEVVRLKSAGGWNNDWDLTHRIVTQAGIDVRYEEVVERFEALYQGGEGKPGLCARERILTDPGLLERLARRLPLAVVTGRPRRDALGFLERAGIAECFSAIVTFDDAPPKPDPAPVRQALQILGVNRAWMVGDTPDDARAARAADVLPLGILAPDGADAVSADDLIASGCARILNDLQELEEQLP